jgi:catalase
MKRIQEFQVQHFFKADPTYGEGVAKGLELGVSALTEKEYRNRPSS